MGLRRLVVTALPSLPKVGRLFHRPPPKRRLSCSARPGTRLTQTRLLKSSITLALRYGLPKRRLHCTFIPRTDARSGNAEAARSRTFGTPSTVGTTRKSAFGSCAPSSSRTCSRGTALRHKLAASQAQSPQSACGRAFAYSLLCCMNRWWDMRRCKSIT